MRFNDAVFGVVLVLFAIAEMAYTRTFPSLHGQAYGPALFPLLIGVGLLVCGLILIGRGLLLRRSIHNHTNDGPNNGPNDNANDNANDNHGKRSATWFDPGSWASDRSVRINGLLVFLCLLGYILLSDVVGFIPMSLTILMVLLLRFGTGLWQSIVVAVAATALLQGLFANFLLVPLPAGWLQGLIW